MPPDKFDAKVDPRMIAAMQEALLMHGGGSKVKKKEEGVMSFNLILRLGAQFKFDAKVDYVDRVKDAWEKAYSDTQNKHNLWTKPFYFEGEDEFKMVVILQEILTIARME